MAQLPVRAQSLVAVGNEKIGPAPQMIFPDFAGVANSCAWISPKPPCRVPGGCGNAEVGHDGAQDDRVLLQYALHWHHRLKVQVEEGRVVESPAGVEIEL